MERVKNMNKLKCSKCNGDGWTAEHNPDAFNPNTGEHECDERCPIQVQCEHCQVKDLSRFNNGE